jgi:hypothetical protein
VPIPRLPGRAFALIGLTGGCYAVSLAAVAGLQSASEGAEVAARAPYASGVAQLAGGNDRLESNLPVLADLDAAAVDANDRLTGAMTALEARLGGLSTSVSAVDGAARALPARAPMPVPVRSVGVSRAATPAHAATGGSGAP